MTAAMEYSEAMRIPELRSRTSVRALSSPVMSARSNASVARSVTSQLSCTSFASRPGVWRCPQCSATSPLPMKRCAKCCAGVRSSSKVPLLGSTPSASRASLAVPTVGARPPSLGKALPTVAEKPEAQALLACLRRGGDLSEVKMLLGSCRQAVNVREDSFGWAPMLFAAHAGDPQLLELLVASRADVRASCNRGNTALHLAAAGGHARASALLAEKGADIEAKTLQGWTPLIWSAITGQTEAVAELLERGASVREQDVAGRTACMWAARHGHTGVVQQLLGTGLDLTVKDEEGLTVKDHAREYENLRMTLREAGTHSLFNAAGSDGVPHGLRPDGSLDLARVVARRGSGSAGGSAGTTGVLGALPAEVVDEAAAASRRLLAAAKAGDWNSAREALEAGACASTRGAPHQRSPLIWAAIHEDASAAMLLAKAKADLETRDELGWTALHHAVYGGSAELVSVLHFLGADFAAASFDGDTAAHLAARGDAGALLQLMQHTFADLNGRDAQGRTPLHLAAMRGCSTSLTTLIALGADITARDRNDRTVVALGVMYGHEAVVSALLEPLPALEPSWREEELIKLLKTLPWECEKKAPSKKAPGKKRSGHKKTLAAITEGDSDAESALSSPRGSRSPERDRPDSARSVGSAASVQSRASERSRASTCSRATAQSGRSIKSSATAQSSASVVSRSGAQSRPGSVRSRSGSAASSPSRPGSVRSTPQSRPGSVRSTTSKDSSRSSVVGSTGGSAIPKNPIGLLLQTCKASAKPSGAPTPGEPPFSRGAALAEGDEEGRAALSQAVCFQHVDLVAALLSLRADVQSSDREGNTALMLAAERGDKFCIAHLLEARARVDARNSAGQRAFDLAATPELKSLLEAQAARDAVGRKLGSSCSLPTLSGGRGAGGRAAGAVELKLCRLRLDGLPVRHPKDHLEELLRMILEDYDMPAAKEVEVAVDPFSLRPCGHALIAFANEEEARAAERTLLAESNMRVSLEVV